MPTVFQTITRKLKKSLKFILVAVVLAAIIYKVKFSPTSVKSFPVERASITAFVLGTGTLDAKIKATISPKISGRLDSLLVDQGDKVKAGQLLAILDDTQLKLDVELAAAHLETSRSIAFKTEKDLEIQRAILEHANSSFLRQKSLLSKRATSQDRYDKVFQELKTARARLARSEIALTESKLRIIEATRTLELKQANQDESYLKAPFDGLVIRRYRDKGNIVVPGTSILTLISTDVLWVRAWVDESALAELCVGQSAKVVFRSEPDHPYSGKVARIGTEVDRETREYIVDVIITELPKNWAIGQRAEALIQVAQKSDVLTIPASALLREDGQPGVFINKSGKAQWRTVSTGLRGEGKVEITHGLSAGDSVILPSNPNSVLKNGTRIE